VSFKQGQVVAGKYRLNALLGTGGMASVWSATNTFTERQFAIKFLLPSFAKTPEAATRFLMEAKVSGRVQHPNVIEIIDVGQAEDGSLFLVMELLQGESLEHAMRQQKPPMTVFELLTVMLEVARAMAAAHRAGIVHRDLKPTNVLLHKDRAGIAVPKVLDFGVSKFVLEAERDNSLTIAGTVLGSPLYMSPEQARGQLDIDHRTDVYAFGAILFEGVCGFRCFDAPNFNALIVTITTTEPKSVDQYAPQMPESLRALVRDCLATDKTKRVDSFDTVVTRLTPILAELKENPLRLPTPVPRPGETPPDPESTRAMPAIIRPNDDPLPPMPGDTVPPGSAAPWAGSVGYRSGHDNKPPIALFVAAGAAFTLMTIGAIAIMVLANRHGGREEPTAASLGRPAATQEVIELPATPSTVAEVPVVSIDDLPAKAKQQLHLGKLSVDSQPLACTVAVDGKVRGTTPVLGLDVPAGAHVVRCETTSGIAKSTTVSVVEGQTARAHFSTNP
jgi:serine/threonine protein kinase